MEMKRGQKRADLSIIDVARPMEAAIIQGSAGRDPYIFRDPYKTVQFVHFSDCHSDLDHWDRIMTFTNYYKDYISFAIHTGDFVAGTIEGWKDLYSWGIPRERPALNCIGNHDRATREHVAADKALVHSRLFNQTDDWDVTFMEGEGSMTYYKDFPESNVRLIVLDLYYDLEQQIAWLKDLFARSMEEGVHVMTAMHQPTSTLVTFPPTTFHTAMDWTQVHSSLLADAPVYPTVFEDTIADFIEAGGHYICNLCGHHHRDLFGYTERGVLNIAVEETNSWGVWKDDRRVYNTYSYDCFNVTSVDVNTGIIRIARIGNNFDYYMRKKTTMCFDYVNKKMIYAG